MLHAYFTPIALYFVYTLWHFYAFSGTNLLTRCHSVSSCFLLFLYFTEPPSTKSSVAIVDVDPSSGGSRSSSRQPVGEGNHHRRPSSSPCLPPEWCMSSSSLDYGSIAVARWLSSPLCASCLDLVSCLSWSRSSLCNSTYCVCWDPMNIEYYVNLIIDLSCLCYLWSCMLSVSSRCFGQVDACNSKREYLCSKVGSCL
jgi:hypothetical protein